ncbi:MAG: hypothetical protein KDI66_23265 [Xanthomonadales bacterium]|nr:hypothetical protein [Xanthomonadales bacterium]
MRDHFVNRYVVVLGHCGLGGTAYEIHATSEDLVALAEKLKLQAELFQKGEHAFLAALKEQGMEWRESDPFPVLSEYVTLSESRTDRMCISFYAEKSLQAHHVMKSELGIGVAKLMWYLVFPIIGVGTCIWSFLRWIMQ